LRAGSRKIQMSSERAAVTSRRGLRALIAGGGVAALEAMLALRALAEERVSIELLAPEPHSWYRPLAVA
jgi:sulfide:quinone oxidoreductase